MMNKKYFRKEGESSTGSMGIFYFEFVNDFVVKQIEIFDDEKYFLDATNPELNGHMLADQSIAFFEFDPSDVITAEEFYWLWNNRI